MDDGARTRDLNLGKVARYQLRYIHKEPHGSVMLSLLAWSLLLLVAGGDRLPKIPHCRPPGVVVAVAANDVGILMPHQPARPVYGGPGAVFVAFLGEEPAMTADAYPALVLAGRVRVRLASER